MSSGSPENKAAFQDEALLADAQANSGLTDFGPDEFRPALARLTWSLREEAPLNDLGRTILRTRIVESLETRLRIQHWIERHPEILDEEIGAPIVVIGQARTGTTMLQRIIASDPRNHACMWWETRFPAPHADTDWSQPDPRIPIAEAEVAAILEADPRQASIHPWDAHAPDEEIMLLEHSFLSYVPEAFCNVPTYRSWISEQDWTPTYQYLKKLLQSLQWQKRQRGNVRERWVLKAPNHLGFIDTLFETFPGANVILTHRDPIETVSSAASMNGSYWALYGDPAPEQMAQAGAQWRDRMAWSATRCMDARKRHGDQRFADLWFLDALKDPITEIERAYSQFGIEFTDAARAGMEQWRADNPRGNRPPHEYTLEEYGLTEDGIKEAFADYRKTFIEPRL